MRNVTYWLGYLWALPLTFLGVLVAVLTGSRFIGDTPGGVLLVQLSAPVARAFIRLGFVAITLGAVQLYTEAGLLPEVMAHERMHWHQQRALGVLFLVAYPLASVYAIASGGHYYNANVFEVDAERRRLGKR